MPQSPQITGGEFSYMRRVKTGDYEHAEAKALLNFSTPEGSDYRAVFDEATNASVSQVLKVLGLSLRPMEIAVAEKPARAATKTTKKAADPSEVAAVVDPSPTSAPIPTGSAAPNPTDPASVESVQPATGADTLVIAAAQADPASVEDWTVPEQPVTDTALLEAINQRNSVLMKPVAIRALIHDYVKPGQGAKDIPMDKRRAFLDRLKNVV